MKCCVKNCNNRQKNRKEGMKFFSFPKDCEVRKKWVEACGNPKVATYKHGTICSEHFENAAYKLQVQLGFSGQKGSSQLQPNAVPTKNLPEKGLELLVEDCSQGMKAEVGDVQVSGEAPSTNTAEVKEETLEINPTTIEAIFLEEHPYEVIVENSSEITKAEDGDASLSGAVQVKDEPFSSTPTTSEELIYLKRNRMLEARVAKLEAMNKELLRQKQQDMEWFKRKIKKMKMQEQISRSTQALRMEEEMQQILSTIFTPGQVECLLHKKKKVKWNPVDVRSAMSLMNVSPKAYKYLRDTLKFPLPGFSTLRMPRWASSIEDEPDQFEQTEENSEPLSEM